MFLLIMIFNFINTSPFSNIYKIHQILRQMSIVEKKEITTHLTKFNQSVTKKSQGNQSPPNHSKGPSLEYNTYQIDHKMLPFIFRFNYAALVRLKMKKAPGIPKLANEIFQYLRDKLVVKRYSEGGKFPNRMKYQEKVKFLMRAFCHRRGSNQPSQLPKRKQKFNRQKQLQFFTRPQVRQHFLQQINDALIKKKLQNERRIRDMQDCIEMAISFFYTNVEKANKIFQQRIKRKQLPWTDNMFQDIEDFSRQLFSRYSSQNIEAQRQAIKKEEEKKQKVGQQDEQQQAEVDFLEKQETDEV